MMKRKSLYFFYLLFAAMTVWGCRQKNADLPVTKNVRQLVDTVGFAQHPWQMDSIISRIKADGWKPDPRASLRLAIVPHDDYTYVGRLYPVIMQNIRARYLFLIGVAHKAARFKAEDYLVFDTHDYWKGPWSDVPVSSAREDIYEILKEKYAVINDSLQDAEHSLEALIPYLQYFNRKIEIIPILVPFMSPSRMEDCGRALAEAIGVVAEKKGWKWGSDFAIVATTDAVHYGNEDWGGSDYAFFGCDDQGNSRALRHEMEITGNCLLGFVNPEKIALFSEYTLYLPDYKKYRWTWCGRYSIPVALYTSYFLNDSHPLRGIPFGYSTSIRSLHILVDDIGMGHTAIATKCHWVGYASVGYK